MTFNLGRINAPKLNFVQLELSSHCNASCSYCPQTLYKGKIRKAFLTCDAIEKILPQLRKDTYLHLQGWGEPFLNPEFREILSLIKKNGFCAGTTTNAALLNKKILKELVDLKLDYLAFSTSGHTEFENDSTRKGTSFQKITDLIFELKKIKKAENTDTPKIHIANITLKNQFESLFRASDFYKKISPDQVVLSSLSFAGSKEIQDAIFYCKEEKKWEEIQKNLKNFRKELDLDFNFHLVSPFILKENCCEDVLHSLFIGSDGDVHPCVFKGLPLMEDVNFYLRGKKIRHENLSFGNIKNMKIKEIWNSKEFRAFRKNRLPENDFCRICYKKSIDYVSGEALCNMDSFDCKWDLIREANKEKEDRKRLEMETRKWRNL